MGTSRCDVSSPLQAWGIQWMKTTQSSSMHVQWIFSIPDTTGQPEVSWCPHYSESCTLVSIDRINHSVLIMEDVLISRMSVHRDSIIQRFAGRLSVWQTFEFPIDQWEKSMICHRSGDVIALISHCSDPKIRMYTQFNLLSSDLQIHCTHLIALVLVQHFQVGHTLNIF